MSDRRGKVVHLMETNTNTETHTETTSAPVARYAELQALVAGMAADDFFAPRHRDDKHSCR